MSATTMTRRGTDRRLKLSPTAQGGAQLAAAAAIAALSFVGTKGVVCSAALAISCLAWVVLRRAARQNPNAPGIPFVAIAAYLMFVLACLTFDFRGTLGSPGPARYLMVGAGVALVGVSAFRRRHIVRRAPELV